jgi:hypothetical protein
MCTLPEKKKPAYGRLHLWKANSGNKAIYCHDPTSSVSDRNQCAPDTFLQEAITDEQIVLQSQRS